MSVQFNDITLFGESLSDYKFLEVDSSTRIYYKLHKDNTGYTELYFCILSRFSHILGIENWDDEGSEISPSIYGSCNHKGVRFIRLSSGDNPKMDEFDRDHHEYPEYEAIGRGLLALEKLESIYYDEFLLDNIK